MKHRNKRFKAGILLAVVCLFSSVTLLTNAGPVEDTLFLNSNGKYPLYKHLYIYAANNKLDPQFICDSIPVANFKLLFPDKAFNNNTSITPYYWLMVTVKNNLQDDGLFYYWLNSPGLGVANAYLKNEGDATFKHKGKSGFYVPLSLRQNHSFDVEFKFLLQKGKAATILLCIENHDGINAFFAPQFADSSAFKIKENNYFFVIGLITGIMLTSFLVNIFFALSLKKNIHYLYAAYIFSIHWEILTLEGITTSYIGSTRFSDMLTHISPPVCGILMTRIMQWFLNQRRDNSRLRIFVDAGTCLLGLLIVVYSIGYFFSFTPFLANLLQIILALAVGVQLLLLVLSAVEMALQRNRSAFVYLLATLWLLVGLFEVVLTYIGVDDVELIRTHHPNDLQLGLAIEAVVVFMAIIYRYNLYKKEKEVLLLTVNEQQQNLINRIVVAEEEERKRIASDLHDDVAATLSTLNLHITNIPEQVHNREDMERYYSRSLALSNKAVNDIRDIAHNLLPKDFTNTRLFSTLQNRMDELNALRKIRFNLIAEGDEKKLSENFAIIVYRIINELLANILKHSIASEASVQLLIEERNLQIMTEDDGIGFNRDKVMNGIGLQNISRRVEYLKGTVRIDSNSNGTNTIINLPL